jgi:hypothetical protein
MDEEILSIHLRIGTRVVESLSKWKAELPTDLSTYGLVELDLQGTDND